MSVRLDIDRACDQNEPKELYSIVRKTSKTKDKYSNWDYYFYPGLEFELWLNLLHWFSFRSIDHKRKWQILKEQKKHEYTESHSFHILLNTF